MRKLSALPLILTLIPNVLSLAFVLPAAGCTTSTEKIPQPGAHLSGPERPGATTSTPIPPAEQALRRNFLLQQKGVLHRVKKAPDTEQAIQNEIRIIRVLLENYARYCPDEERAEIRRDAEDAAISQRYYPMILGPQASASREEAREIFEEHLEDYQRPPGVSALEIFLWAPEDLQPLREKKRALIKRLRSECTDPEAFKKAAREYSEATSAFRSGFIGSIEENQVEGPVHDALFSGHTGLSEILTTPQGLYLFYITKLIPKKDTSFDEVAKRIQSRLRTQRMNALVEKNRKKLQAQLGLYPEAGNSGPVLEIGEESFSARNLEIYHLDEARILRRGLAILKSRILASEGISVPAPDPIGIEWKISRSIFQRLLKEKLEDPTWIPGDSSAQEPALRPPIEKWSFDLLILEDADRPEILYELFRALYEAGENDQLEAIKESLELKYHMEPEIRHFNEVLPSSVAGLGPEIHTTLKTLESGAISHPLHPSQTHRLVVVKLLAKHMDTSVGTEADEHRSATHRRRLGEKTLRTELLEEAQAG